MEFCEVCRNMLYLTCKRPADENDDDKDNDNDKEEDDDAPKMDVLMRYCKHCGFSAIQDTLTSTQEPLRVAYTLYTEDDLLYKQHYNPYLRFDPTLPRIHDPSIKCKKDGCGGTEMLFVKYHTIDMKYFYCCNSCGSRTEYEKN